MSKNTCCSGAGVRKSEGDALCDKCHRPLCIKETSTMTEYVRANNCCPDRLVIRRNGKPQCDCGCHLVCDVHSVRGQGYGAYYPLEVLCSCDDMYGPVKHMPAKYVGDNDIACKRCGKIDMYHHSEAYQSFLDGIAVLAEAQSVLRDKDRRSDDKVSQLLASVSQLLASVSRY